MIDVQTLLTGLRDRFPACESVAFADLSAGMILATSTARDLPQERWDDLCDTAVAMMRGDVAGLTGAIYPDGPGFAILRDKDEIGIFVRSATAPDDSLCCVCRPQVEVLALIAAARDSLARIEAGG